MKHPSFLTLILPAVLLLAACGGPDLRVPVPSANSALRDPSSIPSVELLTVSLPSYASSEQISTEQADGFISDKDAPLWSDDPARAVTLQLTRNLTEITGATVAPEPWPFDAYPAARIDVRVENMLATNAGLFQLSGQYYVSDTEGRGRNSARFFEISEPLTGSDLGALAAARARAVVRLAEDIATRGM
ncbi:hypothetical protein AQS8620_00719 [Aquimixticola soesokkakensis]|uniref:ABC-type transport auxiliary lipoprotein component domain-containing protein n=1 Tax=Aquimixticola soesokkakensis TaxID=1519096 RepID=A0A1Y5RSJ5_9RHOB|nr:ABC-type transport auxiliary lipoprotein family protein [Aquimixticola soesokkakensis]SLN24498.1 hypothetical protein AQS8620_00719 [Aquimixticola soesokkakensis]